MIRYDVGPDKLDAAVDAISPTWRTRAATRTAGFIAAGEYEEASSIWSEVKPVYMAAQSNKCVFCERQFEDAIHGKIEFDLEHFRPKSSIAKWPDPARHAHAYDFQTGDHAAIGYYWLAYGLSNYAASCKNCNTNLKSNYFPIAGNRGTAQQGVNAEQPFLCYPIGTSDTDPEELLTFVATTAVPKSSTAHDRRRGQIMIDFFDLNKREELHRQRANMIVLLGSALVNLADDRGDEADEQLARRIVENVYPHTNCVRAFRATWDNDQDFARRVLRSCKTYYASEKGTDPPQFQGA